MNICEGSLRVGPTSVSGGETRPEQPGLGVTVAARVLLLPSKRYFGLLAALPVCIACAPAVFPTLLCSRLLFGTTDMLTPSQNKTKKSLFLSPPALCSLIPVRCRATGAHGPLTSDMTELCLPRTFLATSSFFPSLYPVDYKANTTLVPIPMAPMVRYLPNQAEPVHFFYFNSKVLQNQARMFLCSDASKTGINQCS